MGFVRVYGFQNLSPLRRPRAPPGGSPTSLPDGRRPGPEPRSQFQEAESSPSPQESRGPISGRPRPLIRSVTGPVCFMSSALGLAWGWGWRKKSDKVTSRQATIRLWKTDGPRTRSSHSENLFPEHLL